MQEEWEPLFRGCFPLQPANGWTWATLRQKYKCRSIYQCAQLHPSHYKLARLLLHHVCPTSLPLLPGRFFTDELGAEAEIFYRKCTTVVELVETDAHRYMFDPRSGIVDLAKQERPSTAENFPSKRRASSRATHLMLSHMHQQKHGRTCAHTSILSPN